jgi:NADPH-dependent ferric siderophore reductase
MSDAAQTNPKPTAGAPPTSGPQTTGRPPKKRGPPKRTIVERIDRLTPEMLSIAVKGDDLAGFATARPGAHMKLLFPDSGWNAADPEAPRPPSRTYTPRRYDAARGTLEIEFVMHGGGLASNWAERARVGDTLYVAGPGGGYDVPPEIKAMVLVVDESALPAAGMIVEALPLACQITALCEIAGAAEERPLSPVRSVAPTWLHRGAAPANALLEKAVAGLNAPVDCYWWIACEAGAMRRIKAHLLKERHVAPQRLHTRGYWLLGNTNYPDHDYGNDA